MCPGGSIPMRQRSRKMIKTDIPLLVLASASPRRRELIAHLHREVLIEVSAVEEVITKTEPAEVVCELATQKAECVAKKVSAGATVIGADTVVACDGRILGKPKDRADAIRMLSMLSGRKHSVYTGVALCRREGNDMVTDCFYEETKVEFYPMSQQEMESYVDSGDPMDKAGAYGIQSGAAIFVKSIEGDYNTVVGLPVAALYQRLKVFEK